MARQNKRNRENRRLAEQLTALQVSKATLTKHSGPLPHPNVPVTAFMELALSNNQGELSPLENMPIR